MNILILAQELFVHVRSNIFFFPQVYHMKLHFNICILLLWSLKVGQRHRTEGFFKSFLSMILAIVLLNSQKYVESFLKLPYGHCSLPSPTKIFGWSIVSFNQDLSSQAATKVKLFSISVFGKCPSGRRHFALGDLKQSPREPTDNLHNNDFW